ncbi:hypothetical protein BDV97DRAFT_92692 [Delphinella strobiligena]|nr:hypothetical protein BDV97DRAFT_92692 [Delphinella strobiligena]
MPRMTRAAAAAQAQAAQEMQMHTDDSTEPAATEAHAKSERAPLNEIVPNAADPDSTESTTSAVKSKANGMKGKKNKKAERSRSPKHDSMVEAADSVHEEIVEMMMHENISEQGGEDEDAGLLQGDTGTIHQDSAGVFSAPESSKEDLQAQMGSDEEDEARQYLEPADIVLEAESPSVEPEEIILLPQRTLAKDLAVKEASTMRSTSDKENEQHFSNTTIEHSSVDGSPPHTLPVQSDSIEDPIQSSTAPGQPFEAIHMLDEVDEQAATSNPQVDTVSPVEQTPRPDPPARATPPTTKTSASRQAGRPSTLGKPGAIRPKHVAPQLESTTGRPSSVRNKAVASKAGSTQGPPTRRAPLAKPSISRPSTVRDRSSTMKWDIPENVSPKEKTPTVIPHSKPRPVSLSFPTPPAPPKSTKAPTRSIFQLPGEAIAAKLRAAREERKRKEEEDIEKRRAFKARPAPKIKDAPTVARPATSEDSKKKEDEEAEKRRVFKARPAPKPKAGPAVVRQTASSRARESLMLGKQPSGTDTTTSNGIKTVTSADQIAIKSRPSTATKRVPNAPETIAEGTDRAAMPSIRVAKRTSVVAPNKSHVRNASAPTVSQEKQKREKEEAARKARADAAERGRIASREWAEKMKLKTLKAKEATTATTATTTTAV